MDVSQHTPKTHSLYLKESLWSCYSTRKNRKKYQHVYCANDSKNGEQIQNFLATIMACNSEILTYHKIKALNRLHQLNAVACIEKYNFTSEVLN